MSKFPVYLLAGFACLMIFALWRWNPSQHADVFSACFFKKVTGFECPGCGGTRATHALLNGRVKAAHAFNPLIIPLLGLLIYPLLRLGITCLFGKSLPALPMGKSFWWILAGAFTAFTVIRNL